MTVHAARSPERDAADGTCGEKSGAGLCSTHFFGLTRL